MDDPLRKKDVNHFSGWINVAKPKTTAKYKFVNKTCMFKNLLVFCFKKAKLCGEIITLQTSRLSSLVG